MSIHTDKKFITALSPHLERFEWKKDTLAVCRCPFCGDSKKSRLKTRGFFFNQDGKFLFKCHNCGVCHSLYTVLENVSPALCKDYVFENFKDKKDEAWSVEPKRSVIPIDAELGFRLDMLSDSHMAVKYVESRKIPREKHSLLYYTDDFSGIMENFGRESKVREARLVIPTFDDQGRLIGVQGRAFAKDAKIRYISLKQEGVERVWFNLNNINPRETVYVVEGPLDSLFVPNCIAMQGAGWVERLPDKIAKSDVVFIFDNQPENPEIVAIMKQYIARDRKVVIWPSTMEEKDINDMVLAHGQTAMINTLINRVYKGLQAQIEFAEWKRI